MSQVQIGQSGSSGNITLGNLSLTGPRLDLFTNGGGDVTISGDLDVTTSKVVGFCIYGDGGTTQLGGNITSNAAVIIDDAVELNASITIDTSGGNAKVTLLGGAPAGGSEGIFLVGCLQSRRIFCLRHDSPCQVSFFSTAITTYC